MTRTVNEQLLDGSIRHMVWLERYKTGTVRKIIALLNKADADLVEQIAARLASIEQRGFDLGPDTTARLKELRDTIKAQRAELSNLLEKETRLQLNEFAAHEAEFNAKLIEAAIGSASQVTLARPTLSQLEAIVASKPFQGRLLGDWFTELGRADGERIADAVSIGLAEGQTTDQIIRRVRGTRAAGYADGVLEITRRNAASVVRTAAGHVANYSAEQLYAANADIVKGVKWVATLDGRTTAVCRARDGEVFKLFEGPRPPAHWGCRSRTVPFLGETSIKGKRASMFGPVPGDVTYQDWLRTQGAEVQNEILGPTRAKLFRQGGLTLDRFVDDNGRSYTLDQLKVRDADIWNEVF